MTTINISNKLILLSIVFATISCASEISSPKMSLLPSTLSTVPMAASSARLLQAVKAKPAKKGKSVVPKKLKLKLKVKGAKKGKKGLKLKVKAKTASKPSSEGNWTAKQLANFVTTIGKKQKAAKTLFQASTSAAAKILKKLDGNVKSVQAGVAAMIKRGKAIVARYAKLRADILKTSGKKATKRHLQQLKMLGDAIGASRGRRLGAAEVSEFEKNNAGLINKFLAQAEGRTLQKKKAKKGKLAKATKKGKKLLKKLKLKLKSKKSKKDKKAKKAKKAKKDDKDDDDKKPAADFSFKKSEVALGKLEKSWKLAKKGVIKALAMKKKLSKTVKTGMQQSARFFKNLKASLSQAGAKSIAKLKKAASKSKKPVLKAKLTVKGPKKAAKAAPKKK